VEERNEKDYFVWNVLESLFYNVFRNPKACRENKAFVVVKSGSKREPWGAPKISYSLHYCRLLLEQKN
jgi:hypothetical protein